MLMAVKNQLKVSLLSVKYALIREMLNKTTFVSNIIFMILNNASFLIQWVILFSLKDNFGSYTFDHVLLLWGLSAGTYGFSRFFFKNAFKLSKVINDGKLDSFLVQPKNVLISTISSSVSASALGDIIYAYIVLFIYGVTITYFVLFTIFCILGAIILIGVAIIVGSLSFWFNKSDLFADSVNSMLLNFSTYPDAIFNQFIKGLFYTIIPIGFTVYLPVSIIVDFNVMLLLLVIGVTIISITLAFIIFYKGLKRYSSTNLMIAKI